MSMKETLDNQHAVFAAAKAWHHQCILATDKVVSPSALGTYAMGWREPLSYANSIQEG
ncbi:hypothetical protein PAAG_12555 [Paracoccidioides lutzii Pb01]|uniref:Uncharacterized protein n=1 Tax=Paracoccidioides lutzii (strain ATCC MYA-826 / Pb01) TaxID=502779 RepID=A0A0A2UYX7_PARBA|nr:hypothetical protein PAAG_12555 [Paracoccidioides lutzii Pb01]KGQ00771.1 hypothetical protein PAAG_12555 [Paracoccidioides lutzii Pb01]